MGRRNNYTNPAFLTGVVVVVSWIVVAILWPVVVVYYFLLMGLLFVSFGTYCSLKKRISKFKAPVEIVQETSKASKKRSAGDSKSKRIEPADDSAPPPPLANPKANPSVDI